MGSLTYKFLHFPLDSPLSARIINPLTVYASQAWPSNSHLIADIASLGYLSDSALTLDATYGLGNFWKIYRPARLITLDAYTPAQIRGSFLDLPFAGRTFDRVMFDPPYKMNGTPSVADIPYGVHVYARWQDRVDLIVRGLVECARVLKPKGYLLVKCMDAVVSGKVVWQTDICTAAANKCGLAKIDRLDFLRAPREQPHDRQVHARRNYSSLLIFQ